MIGVCDRIIHGYLSVNWVIVWDIILHEIEPLKLHVIRV